MLALECSSVEELAGRLPDPGTWMGTDELRRLEASGSRRRETEFLTGRWLVRQLLQRQGLIGAGGRISISTGGAPRVDELPQVCLSLSHRDGWLAAAVADGPVGIDVEVVRPRDVTAVADQICTARERARLLAMEASAALVHLHEIWALKEAAFKAGLSRWSPMEFFRIESLPDAAEGAHATSWVWPDGRLMACATAGLAGSGLHGAWRGAVQISQWRIQEELT